MFDVEFYMDRDGNEPIKNFIIELQLKGKTSKHERIQKKTSRTPRREIEQAKRNQADHLERSK